MPLRRLSHHAAQRENVANAGGQGAIVLRSLQYDKLRKTPRELPPALVQVRFLVDQVSDGRALDGQDAAPFERETGREPVVPPGQPHGERHCRFNQIDRVLGSEKEVVKAPVIFAKGALEQRGRVKPLSSDERIDG